MIQGDGAPPKFAEKNPISDGTFASLVDRIPHYHGDVARQLLVGTAALLLLSSPLYGDNLRLEFPFELLGALAAVAAAAFTSPHNKNALIADAVVSGAGAVIYGTWAIFGYDSINPMAFAFRIVIAVAFMLAFYFSLKTVRAFSMHQVGKREQFGEFVEDETNEMIREDAPQR